MIRTCRVGMRASARASVLVATVGLLATGCGSSGSGVTARFGAGGQEAVEPAVEEPTLSVAVETRLSVGDSRVTIPGTGAGISVVRPSLPGGGGHRLLDVRDGGELLLSRDRAPGPSGVRPSTVGVLHGDRFTPFPPPKGGRPRTTLSGSVDAGHAAWFVTSTPDNPSEDWAVLVHDRRSKRTRVIATSGRQEGPLREVPGGTVPLLRGDHAYWVAVDTDPPAGSEPRVGIQRRRLDGEGPVEVVVQGAKLAGVHGDDLFYVRSHDVAPETAAGRYEIHRWRDGRDEVVAAGRLRGEAQVSALSAGIRSVAWSVSGPEASAPGLVYVLDLVNRTAVEVELEASGRSTELDHAGPLVVWGNGTGWGDGTQYLFEPRTRVLYQLGEQEGASHVHGAPGAPEVLWSEAGPSGRVYHRRMTWGGPGF